MARIKLFGSLRALHEGDLELNLAPDLTVAVFKRQLETRFAWDVLADCAVATEERVLASDEVIPWGMTLAVLPPVCGG